MTSSVGTASATTGTTSWTSPSNAYTDNGVYATTSSTVASNTTHSGALILLGWGFALPSGSTVDGVTVTVNAKNANAGAGFQMFPASLRLSGGTLSGTATKNSAAWSGTTDTNTSVGGATDLWSASSIAYTDVNDTSFGVRIVVKNTNGSTQVCSIDYVSITVYYTESSGVISSQQMFFNEF